MRATINGRRVSEHEALHRTTEHRYQVEDGVRNSYDGRYSPKDTYGNVEFSRGEDHSWWED